MLDLSENRLTGTLPAAWGDGRRAARTRRMASGSGSASGAASGSGSPPAGVAARLAAQQPGQTSGGGQGGGWRLTSLTLEKNELGGTLPATWASAFTALKVSCCISLAGWLVGWLLERVIVHES